MPNRRYTIAACALFAAIAVSITAQQQPMHTTLDLTVVKPESVGFSSERLDHLHALIQDEVDRQQLSGAITLLARHGKVVDFRLYGKRDLATGTPMSTDTIFRGLLHDQARHRRSDDDPL